jgi:hypothetical protein
MLHGKTRGGKVDGHNQIQLAPSEAALEKVHEEGFLFWFGESRRIQGRFVNIKGFRQLSGQGRPESRGHSIERRDSNAIF